MICIMKWQDFTIFMEMLCFIKYKSFHTLIQFLIQIEESGDLFGEVVEKVADKPEDFDEKELNEECPNENNNINHQEDLECMKNNIQN